MKLMSDSNKLFLWECKFFIFWFICFLCIFILFNLLNTFDYIHFIEEILNQSGFIIFALVLSPFIILFETNNKGEYSIDFFDTHCQIKCQNLKYNDSIRYSKLETIIVKKSLLFYNLYLCISGKRIRIPQYYFDKTTFLKIYKLIYKKANNAKRIKINNILHVKNICSKNNS